MRVGLVYGFPLRWGGVEAHILSLARLLDPGRFEVAVIGDPTPEFCRRALTATTRFITWRTRRVVDPIAILRLLKIVRANRIDLLHAHSPRMGIITRIVAVLARVPSAVTVHLPPSYSAEYGRTTKSALNRGFSLLVERRLANVRGVRLIYVSRSVYMEATARLHYSKGIAEVIENGIDIMAFRTAVEGGAGGQVLGLDPGDITITTTARLDRQKGLDIYLDALALVKGRLPRCKVLIAGDGLERERLKARIVQLGLEPLVRLLGFRNDVPALLAASDLFVLPSRFEAAPLALIEAMASRLPVIATDTGDCARWVQEGRCGVVVPPEDPAALAEAVLRLAHDEELRGAMGTNALEYATRFSAATMVERVERVYERLLGGAGG
jgi:glycosyltransferase involved in cell wall biosynthesis